MNVLYLLEHCYEAENGDDVFKVLGVFSSKEMAESKIRLYKQEEGFNRYDADCFIVSRFIVNQGDWSEGFVSLSI